MKRFIPFALLTLGLAACHDDNVSTSDPTPTDDYAYVGQAVGTAAVVAGLAVSFLAAAGYRRKKVSIEEAKAGWTPEQRAKADREVAEALRRESAE